MDTPSVVKPTMSDDNESSNSCNSPVILSIQFSAAPDFLSLNDNVNSSLIRRYSSKVTLNLSPAEFI